MLAALMNLMLLSVESNHVVVLRLQRLQTGGAPAWDEYGLMMGEKIEALGKAMATLASGRGVNWVVSDYRTVVRANIQRLRHGGSSKTGALHLPVDT